MLILMSFSAFAHLFHLFYTGKTFPGEDFFHTRGKKKKRSLGVSSDEQGGWGMGVVRFWSKIAEYLVWCGQVHCQETCKCVECLQKNGGPPQPRTMPADRCRWVPRTLLLLAEACTEGARPPEDNPRVFFCYLLVVEGFLPFSTLFLS